MVPTIPPEIWLRTALFIPSSTLRNLYSVNSVFLDLALDERYSNIDLAVRWTAATTKLLKHLNHPHIAHRVKRLTLSSNWLESNMYLDPSEEVSLGTAVAWYLPFNLGRFLDPIASRVSSVKECNALMEITVANFTNVSSLFIVDTSALPAHNQPGPLLVNAYTACASKLRTLSLATTSGTSANFSALFPPNASALTSLEEVTLSFSFLYDSGATAKAASTFFQAVTSTLTSLDISLHSTTEPSPLLQILPCQGGKAALPKLTSFSLSYLEHPVSPVSIPMQFINQHADTLKHLRLQHSQTSPFVSHSHPSLLPVLPHLETLDISHGSSTRNRQQLTSSEGLDAARAYVQHSWSTLTGLNMTHCSFTLHDLGMLLDLLGQRSSKNTERGVLKSLTVAIQILSPQMLDMMAEKLPQLERLKVDFTDLRSNDGTDVPALTSPNLGHLTHEDIESFLLQMRTRSYSMWGLRSFGIAHVSMRPVTARDILIPLTLCIPHLVEIDGPFMKMWREPGSTWRASNCGDSIFNGKLRSEVKRPSCKRTQSRTLLIRV